MSTGNRVDVKYLSAVSISRPGDDRRANARDEFETETATEKRDRFLGCGGGMFPLSAWVRAGTDSRRTAVVEAVEKVQRSVVSISSEKLASSHSRWPFSSEDNQLRLVNGMGSGILVDGRGYIVTNHHVVDKVQGVIVQLVRWKHVPGSRPSE